MLLPGSRMELLWVFTLVEERSLGRSRWSVESLPSMCRELSEAEMSKTQAGSKLLQKKLLKAHPSVIQDRGLDVVVALLVVAKITFSVSLACCVLFLLPPFPEKGALGHDMGVKQGGRVWLIPAGPSWSGVWPRSASEDSDPTDQSQDILEGLEAELPEIMCNMWPPEREQQRVTGSG